MNRDQPTDERWIVETRPGDFDDVGASSLTIESATLIFRDEDGDVLVAYAPHAWTGVSR